MDFKSVDKKYRPIPFWSWNEKLEVDETLRQTALMDEAGMGGYFMHARGGLQTEYMGEEWFENVAACVNDAKARGMHAWAYDEDGWPSGFGGGKVNGKGEKYWQKYLRVRPAGADISDIPEHRIIKITDKYCFYYEVNQFYVDTLDGEVIADFIKEIYEPYYERFGSGLDGFFTDEPQISRNGIPWSLTMTAQYRVAYGEELEDVLGCLFFEEDGFEDVRLKFWKLCTCLFSKNFMKQIGDWCMSHGYGFTGHMVLEENLRIQITSNGACMPHYEYFTIPGMDWLGRNIPSCLTQHQVASAAAQTGKKQILSETFALCGHNVGHDELRRNYEWMMVRGINLMCQHLEGYSLRGIRKRDYPPAMYYQQPWWKEYKVFNDAMSRVGMILAEGRIKFDTLVIHNISSAWICFNNDSNTYVNGKDISYYNSQLLNTALALEAKHIPFHFGDEIMMERHGRVEGNKLIIGEMEYTKVIVPEHIRLLPNTERLLAEFEANGGIITTVDAVEPNGIVDSEKITYTCREYDGFTVHYFVSSNKEEIKAKISRGSYAINIETGEREDFFGEYTFPPYGSLLLIDDGTPHAEKKAEKTLRPLDMSGEWDIVSQSMNSVTLDKCTYWFDGELQETNGYVLDVGIHACDLERAVDVRCEFETNIEYIGEKLYLVCETPEIFTVKVNGEVIDKTDCGYIYDKSFRMLDIKKYARIGKNTVELSVKFEQSEKTYENIRNAHIFESEKNKLTYDMEIESLYLVGDFGVRCDGNAEEIVRKAEPYANEVKSLYLEDDSKSERYKDLSIRSEAYFFDGTFTLCRPADKLILHNIDRQGYPFFAGEIKVSKKFDLTDTNYKICLNKRGVNAIRVAVNGKHVRTVLWGPYDVDISEYLKVGENVVEFTLYNNLRNLLGPHHHTEGELYGVSPASFYKIPCIWNHSSAAPYTDKYCFVNTGIV